MVEAWLHTGGALRRGFNRSTVTHTRIMSSLTKQTAVNVAIVGFLGFVALHQRLAYNQLLTELNQVRARVKSLEVAPLWAPTEKQAPTETLVNSRRGGGVYILIFALVG